MQNLLSFATVTLNNSLVAAGACLWDKPAQNVFPSSTAGIRSSSFMPNNPALSDQAKEGSRIPCSIEMLSGEDRIRTSSGHYASVDSAHTNRMPEEWERSPEIGPVPGGIPTQGTCYIPAFAWNIEEPASISESAREPVSGELVVHSMRTTRRLTSSDPLELRTDIAVINTSDVHAQNLDDAPACEPSASTSRPLEGGARAQQGAHRRCEVSQVLLGSFLRICALCEIV